jgi:hypothetical protein
MQWRNNYPTNTDYHIGTLGMAGLCYPSSQEGSQFMRRRYGKVHLGSSESTLSNPQLGPLYILRILMMHTVAREVKGLMYSVLVGRIRRPGVVDG